MGSSTSLRRRIKKYAAMNLPNSSMATHHTMRAVSFDTLSSTIDSSLKTGITTSMPTKKVSARSFFGSGCLRSSRIQNKSQRNAGISPAKIAMIYCCDILFLDVRPPFHHKHLFLTPPRQRPQLFGNVGHKGVKQHEQCIKYVHKKLCTRSIVFVGAIFKHELAFLKDCVCECVPRVVIQFFRREVEAIIFHISSHFSRERGKRCAMLLVRLGPSAEVCVRQCRSCVFRDKPGDIPELVGEMFIRF